MKKTGRIICSAVFILCFSLTLACAFDDGFGASRKIKSKYFDIYYSPQLKAEDLAKQLNVSIVEQAMTGHEKPAKQDPSLELGEMFDTLFLRISDILGMPLYSFRATIKICRTKAELNRICNALPVQEGPIRGQPDSFCSFDLNTIYISAENFSSEILGHEITHALINHYFVVSPPQKVAEILSSYVEYKLRQPAQGKTQDSEKILTK